MKKLILAIILSSVCIFTGCASWAANNISVSTFPRGSYGGITSHEIDYPRSSAEELAAEIDAFPIDEISLPDGSTVSKNDAIAGAYGSLYFDFAFCCVNTESGFKIVRKGDIFENGLEVNGALCAVNKDGVVVEIYMTTMGEITFSGVLSYYPKGKSETMEAEAKVGELYVMPDTPQISVPCLLGGSAWDAEVYSDSIPWGLGTVMNKQYEKFDLETLFGGNTQVRVTVTIKDPDFTSLISGAVGLMTGVSAI